MFSLKILTLIMCKGNNKIKTQLLFDTITGKQNVKTPCITRDDERLKRALKLLFFFSEIFPKIYQD